MSQEIFSSLITQSINGDKSSFRKLVEQNQSYVYAIAFRILCNSYEAEEIVQETFIRVWKNLKRYKIQMRFTTWIYKIAVNLCYDRIKANKIQERYFQHETDPVVMKNLPDNKDIEREAANREYAQIIRYLTASLPPKQKIVFVLSELQGFSSAEISAITGLPATKIKSNLYCAKQHIKERLLAIENRRVTYAI